MHVNTNIKIKLLSNFYFKNVNQCLLDVECSSWTSWMFKWLMILITLVIYDFFTIRNSSNLWTITKDLSSHVHCGHLMSSSVVLLLRFFFFVFLCVSRLIQRTYTWFRFQVLLQHITTFSVAARSGYAHVERKTQFDEHWITAHWSRSTSPRCTFDFKYHLGKPRGNSRFVRDSTQRVEISSSASK